jgi:hypothetical protein
VIATGKTDIPVADLEEQAKRERARLAGLRRRTAEVGDPKARAVLSRIDAERPEEQIAAALAAAPEDPNARHTCKNRTDDLKSALDEVEDAIELPALVEDAEAALKRTRAIAADHGNDSEKRVADVLEREVRQAIDARDPVLLKRKIADLAAFRFQILRRIPEFWIWNLQEVEAHRGELSDGALGERLIAAARRAIGENDLDALRSAVNQLVGLLPEDRRDIAQGFGGGVLKKR